MTGVALRDLKSRQLYLLAAAAAENDRGLIVLASYL